jgi:hypothetical protein
MCLDDLVDDFRKLVRLNLIIHVVQQLPRSIDFTQDAGRKLYGSIFFSP